ncbi:MAG: thymidine phosphorylase [Rhodothermia bacterium]|nr:thymidine phosphorylase [Rhodothermia bacterium]
MSPFDPVSLIIKKRDGGELTPDELTQLIDGYTDGQVPDYQMSSFLMAAFLRGMSDLEGFALAEAMLHSGEVLDLSDIPGTKVDKHSTGGVGDKISLILAPLVAAAGVPVPMISGRGLGHTGGTLDKLESIPGFQTDLDLDTYRRLLSEHGVVMIGQTKEVAPADKRLYALRDVTGTVEFIPFIAASIMSKKLAEGIDRLVLDVKAGRGAFMQDVESGRRLAERLTGIGEHFGCTTIALLTRMDDPLGRAIGNWLEVEESLRCLRGEHVEEVTDLTIALAAEMIVLGGAAATLDDAEVTARTLLSSGAAFEKFKEMVQAQGGDVSVIDHPERRGVADAIVDVFADEDQSGYVRSVDARAIGLAAMRLGAGRMTVEDGVDPLAGIELLKKRGEPVQPGDCLARLHTRNRELAEKFSDTVSEAFELTGEHVEPEPIVLDRLYAGKWSTG